MASLIERLLAQLPAGLALPGHDCGAGFWKAAGELWRERQHFSRQTPMPFR